MLVVDGRGGASHGSSRRWLWGGESVVLISVSDAGCGGERGALMAVPDTGFGWEKWGFSWQSQLLVVGGGGGSDGSLRRCFCGRVWCSHGSPRRWLWEGGEAGVLMPVTDAGCRGGETEFSWQSQTLVVGGRGRGSHGIPRHCLCGRGKIRVVGKQWHSWQSQTLFLQWGEARVLMAFPDAGCGGQRRGSHGSPRRWMSFGRQEAVTEAGCGGKEEGFLWQSQTLVVG